MIYLRIGKRFISLASLLEQHREALASQQAVECYVHGERLRLKWTTPSSSLLLGVLTVTKGRNTFLIGIPAFLVEGM